MAHIRKVNPIKSSQYYLYELALERLATIKADHNIVSGRALFPKQIGDKYEDTNKKYEDWAVCSDNVQKSLYFCEEIFKLIFDELKFDER